ncbi:MAG: tetratricopeptide repeat protein [Phycisphaerales bacterium]|nr:tetratricopeptide repeat protein [Phycisphaerales bacterium]
MASRKRQRRQSNDRKGAPSAGHVARAELDGTTVSPKRPWAFRIVVVLLPFAALAIAETVCRLSGYGGYPPVILRVANDGQRTWYATNRPGTDTFFDTRRSRGGGMREIHFADPKPAGTVRIALLGGSAMQGFPQVLPLTNGGFLEAMLRDAWGDSRPVEVLNFGATAVASFPVRCFLDEVLEHDVDLVVIMSGNNEFYGAYGVASLFSAGRSPTAMQATRWVRGLGLTQFIAALQTPPLDFKGTLMERVAAEAQIGINDPLRAAAERSLRENLTAMIARCAERSVPVIVCTLPTNESGLAPIGEDATDALNDAQRAEFAENLRAAKQSLATDPNMSAEHARSAIALADSAALPHFILARALSATGANEEAEREYIKARDCDTMPWRATTMTNRAVRDAAKTGATLCDMEAAFRAASSGGAIGWDLVEDHVHYSLHGQALFAHTLLESFATLPEPLHVDPGAVAGLPDWQAYAERQGQSSYTDLVATERLRSIFNIGFMQRNNGDAAERTQDRWARLLGEMSERDRQAVEQWRNPDLHGYTDFPLTLAVGAYHMQDGDCENAIGMFRVARASVPAVSLWRLESTWYLIKCLRQARGALTPEDEQMCRDTIAAGELLNRSTEATDDAVARYVGLLAYALGDYPKAITNLDAAMRQASEPVNIEMVAALVDAYLQTNQPDRARTAVQSAMRDPKLAPSAQRLQQQLEAMLGGDAQ